MRTKVAFLLICVFAHTTLGQDSVPSQTASDLEPIAVATIHVDKHSFKSGEHIELTILLEAGRGGVTSRSGGEKWAVGYRVSRLI